MTSSLQLSDSEIAIINEISKVGGKNTSDALSKMTDQQLSVEISKSRMVEIEEIGGIMEGDGLAVAIYLKITGDLGGGIVLILPEKSALALVDILLKNSIGTTIRLDEMGQSALKETGNVLAGNYLASLADYLGLKLLESIPDITADTAESIMNALAIELSETTDEALIFKMRFVVAEEVVKGQMLMFFEADSAKKMLEALNKKNS